MAPVQGKKCTCTCTCRNCAVPTGEVCRKKTKKSQRIEFVQGQILHVPLHVPNMDEKLSWNDRELTWSTAGPVFSKCRFVVVFRIFHKQMECLPIYTHGGRGVESKRFEDQNEWISVKDASLSRKDTSDSLFASLYHGQVVRENANIHVTGSVMVERAGDVQVRGMMEKSSFAKLHKRRAKLDKAAREETFKEECRQRGR